MTRSRVKAVGLGLALFTGPLLADDGTPQPTRPAAPVPAPALLPPSVRPTAEWVPSAPSTEFTPVWLPVRKPAAPAAPPAASVAAPAAAVVTPVAPGTVLTWVKPAVEAEPVGAGPRLPQAVTVLGPLPEIPAIPTPPAGPAAVPVPVPSPGITPQRKPGDQPEWQPVPRALPAPRVLHMETPALPPEQVIAQPPAPPAPVPAPLPAKPAATQPTPPAVTVPAVPAPSDTKPMVAPPPTPAPPRPVPSSDDPLPPPRRIPQPEVPPETPSVPPQVKPTVPAGGAELPVAPPHLMVPAGVPVPGKHGTFGSPPVRISKDYPPLWELLGHGDGSGLRGWWGRRTADADGTPATDQFYFRAEYLLWWVNAQHIPALATTSVNGGLGFLGDPGTRNLLGPGNFGDTLRSGMRLRAGWWFDECGSCGIDGSYFFLGQRGTSAAFNSNTFPTITRPFFAPNFPGEFGEIVALPNFSTGTLAVDTSSRLWGFDANVRRALCKTCDFRAEVFAGYRFLGLDESLRVTEFITAQPGNPNDPPGTQVVVQDQFRTQNRFNGGQLGLAAERNWGALSLDGRASVALGNTHQTLDITGSQSRLRPGMAAPDTFAGGLLATGPNLGHFTQDRFSVVPEVSLNLGYAITPTIKAYVGYNFMYWSNVIRPGDQIDRTVDVTLVPNPPAGVAASGLNRPQPTFNQSDLWVHGIQFGLMGRW